MPAPAHLRLIVSAPPELETEHDASERVSTIQSIPQLRARLGWIRENRVVVGLWSASFALLGLAATLLLARP